MKHIGYLLLATLMFVSCEKETIRVTGSVITLDYSIDRIQTLELSHAFEADIFYDSSVSALSIDINEDLQDHLEVFISSSTLRIGLSDNLSIKGNATLRVRLTSNNLQNITLSGASRATMKNEVDQDNMNIELSGASQFYGSLNLDRFDANLSGASQVTISGAIDDADIECSGGSHIEDFSMQIDNLKIECSGASNAELSVSDILDVELSGASQLTYDGDPAIIRQELSGASTLRQRD